jgi:hypothetical protein
MVLLQFYFCAQIKPDRLWKGTERLMMGQDDGECRQNLTNDSS